MISRALGPTSLAAGLVLAACGNSSSPATGHDGGDPQAPGAASTAGALPPTPSAPASAEPAASAPSPASASAAPPVPASAPAVPTAAPLPARSAAPAPSARPAAKTAAADAGAADGGATGAGDAGAADPALTIATSVDAVFAQSKTYAARFKQQYTMKVTGTAKDSSGTVSVERPSKISFRYDPPNKNRIVSDGVTIKVYLADDNQMFETPVAKTQYPGALAFMMGNGIARSFSFTLPPSRYAGTALEGKPLVPNPSYQTVTFLIDTGALANGDPRAMAGVIIVDAQGNRNRFDFQGATQPATFPAGEFSFTPPPGTTITR